MATTLQAGFPRCPSGLGTGPSVHGYKLDILSQYEALNKLLRREELAAWKMWSPAIRYGSIRDNERSCTGSGRSS
jgi:hypothetical protein